MSKLSAFEAITQYGSKSYGKKVAQDMGLLPKRPPIIKKEDKKPIKVIFEIYGRSGNAITNSIIDYPYGTTDDDIEKDFKAWEEHEMAQIDSQWSKY